MTAAEGVRAAIEERNREISIEAGTELALGIGYALVSTLVVFVFGYLIAWVLPSPCGAPRWLTAALITVAFVGVTVYEAWRRTDPLEALDPMSDQEELVIVLSLSTPHVMVINPRRTVAGIAALLLGGPIAVFSGLEDLRRRIPTGERMVEAAARILQDAERGLDVEKVSEPRAAVVLRRLMLIRHETGAGLGRIELTEKGRAIVNAAQGSTRPR